MSPATPLTLDEIARRVTGRLEGSPKARIVGVTHDSRRVRPGDLFAAVTGFETDGHRFVGQAVAKGAAAVLVERAGPWPVPAIVVDDVRAALGAVSNAIYGDPTRRMTVVGITGTNGKTTTSFMAAAVLGTRFDRVAILGTLGLRLEGRVVGTGFTTPEAPDLARGFAELVAEGVKAVSMEVSSHAVELGRVRGVKFAAGAFTNLSAEHLDFHHTMDAYSEAKLAFFSQLAADGAFATVNGDDPLAGRFLAAGPAGTWRYSLEDAGAEIFAERFVPAPDGTLLSVRTPAGSFEARLALAGRFNAENALAAAAIGVGLGIEPGACGDALSAVDSVPGRYEVYRGGGVTAIVDYAHTPRAFERILRTVRDSGANKIFCIFGCGGERDRSKRPEMARIAGTLADVVYLTVDNPRRESIEQIMQDAIAGFEHTGARWERIDDRETAIERAVAEADQGDAVCLLGKGDEEYQLIGSIRHPFSDRAVAQRALATRETVP